MGEVVSLFREQELTPEVRAHLLQRVTDMAIEIALLTSEKERLEERLR